MRSGGPPRVVGRYALYDPVAAGGMATVHFGRLLGSAGFSRTVVIKRLHEKHAADPRFRAMLLDEARLAGRVRHRNVVPTLDVVWAGGELFVVLEYAHGETLARLLRATSESGRTVDWRIVGSILSDVLHGLHAAHEAKSERGEPLDLVHRDVSPQNVIVCADGIARVLDFGIAKAAGRLSKTLGGVIKGKLPYMPPEQLQGVTSRRTDVFAAAVVLWEALTARRLFTGESDGEIIRNVQSLPIEAPSRLVAGLPPPLDGVVLRGLERDPARRFETARDMALALEACGPFATASEVGAWVERVAGAALGERSNRIQAIEASPLPPSDTLSELLGVTRVGEETAPPTARESPEAIAEADSNEAPPPHGSPRGSARVAIGLSLVGGIAVASAITWVALRPPASAAPAASSGSPSANATSEPSMAAAPPLETATPIEPTTSVAPATLPVPGTTHPSVARPSPRPSAGVTSPRSCDPPYSVDSEGHKHFKTECL
jgi:serine/threonine-protein kinase